MKIGKNLGLLLICSSLVLSGCGSNSGDGKTLRLVEAAEPQNMDSAAVSDAVSINILRNTTVGLYDLDKNEQPVLAMAEAEPTKKDNTYTFKLRDAAWNDGKKVRAQDFEFAWKRTLDPKFRSEYARLFSFIKGAEDYNAGKTKDIGIKALDDRTLEVTVAYDVPYFKKLLAFPTFLPQREDVVKKYGDNYAKDYDKMVFNGPFVLSDWKHNQSWEYTKNEKYFDKNKVKLQKATVNIVSDPNAQTNLYKTNKVDYIKLTYDQLDAFKGSNEVRHSDEPVTAYFQFNLTLPLYKNAKVRKAISLAIDKSSLTNDIRKDGSKPMGGIIPPALSASEEGKKFRDLFPAPPQFDAAKAKELWTQGVKESGVSNPVLKILTNDTPTAKKDATVIKEQLSKNLGATVELTTVLNKIRLDRMSKKDFDICIMLWGADYNDPMTFMDIFKSKSEHNYGKWFNAQYDALVDQAENMLDLVKRDKVLRQAEEILVNDSGVAPLYARPKNVLIRSNVKGFHILSLGGDYLLKDVELAK